MKAKIGNIAKNIDYPLLLLLTLLLCSGFVILSSASAAASDRFGVSFLPRQITAAALGFVLLLGLQSMDLSKFQSFEKIAYLFINLLLLAVLVFGTEAKGAQRYLEFGPLRVQPVEPVKIIFILCYAKHLAHKNKRLKTWWQLAPSLIYGAIPLIMIVAMPDLGSGLVFVAIIFGMLVAAGGSLFRLGFLFAGGIGGIVLWIYGHMNWDWWLPLENYQLMRLVVFLNPEYDPRGWGWNLIQAQITVGSGGLWGQGWAQGTQTASGYLPEQWTDFIFCVLGEEFGFVGCFVALALYYSILIRCLMIAARSKDLFGGILISGVVSMFLFHVLQNVGMVIGVMPITGIPLPLVSYGRSALLSGMVAIGMALNVGVYRDATRY